jgi:hypothetical protein
LTGTVMPQLLSLLSAPPPLPVTAAVLLLAGALGLWFRRGRVFLALALLVPLAWALEQAAADEAGRLYAASALLTPLVLGALCFSGEPPLGSARGLARAALVPAASALALWSAAPEQQWLGPWLLGDLVGPVPGSSLPQSAVLAFLLAALATGIRWLLSRSRLDLAFLLALVLCALALEAAPASSHAALGLWAAAAVLALAVLQDE